MQDSQQQCVPAIWREKFIRQLSRNKSQVETVWIYEMELHLHTKYSSKESYKIQALRLGRNLQQNFEYIIQKWTAKEFVYSNIEDYDLSKTTEIDKFDNLEREKTIQFHQLVEQTEQQLKQGGGMTTCIKCGFDRVSFFSLQTRSADEPMTIFLVCENQKCGKRWKM